MKSAKISSQFLLRKPLWLLLLATTFFSCDKDDDDSKGASTVTIVSLDPQSPASLLFGQRVTISYDYNILEADGVRIWVMPYSNGTTSPKYSYTSSPLFQGTGSRNVTFTITSGETEIVVDQLRVIIADPTGTQVISEYFETVSYTFGP
jgi:hypothetical protein